MRKNNFKSVCLTLLSFTMIFTLFALPVTAEEQDSSLFNGAPDEWVSIESNSVSASSSLTNFKAIQKDTTLYLYVDGADLDSESTFFIDSDNDVSTGYNSAYWS